MELRVDIITPKGWGERDVADYVKRAIQMRATHPKHPYYNLSEEDISVEPVRYDER